MIIFILTISSLFLHRIPIALTFLSPKLTKFLSKNNSLHRALLILRIFYRHKHLKTHLKSLQLHEGEISSDELLFLSLPAFNFDLLMFIFFIFFLCIFLKEIEFFDWVRKDVWWGLSDYKCKNRKVHMVFSPKILSFKTCLVSYFTISHIAPTLIFSILPSKTILSYLWSLASKRA